jgi:pyruvate kinase
LGPSSEDREIISALAEAGMSVARFNASHGTAENRRATIERVQAVNKSTDRPIATMLDLSGPEVRTRPIDEPRTVGTGQSVEFVERSDPAGERIGVTAPLDGVEAGHSILLDDGRIETTVEATEGEVVRARVDVGGELRSRVGVNVPGVDLDLPIVTEADERELDVAAETNVDFVAASFVRSGEDVYEVNAALEDRDADIPIVAKIERADAVENMDGIIDAAYGVMVARGDLGVECSLEDVPIVQKRIIRRCHGAGVPVITATEMLDSMIDERRPTRAEASDVANAVLDGTDAVMLSGETAVGEHPVQVVKTMARIVADIESSVEYDEALEQHVPPAETTRTDALARAARFLARDIGASAIVAASESGYTARKAAKYRPAIPIVAVTPSARVRRQLALSWGITPVRADYGDGGADEILQRAVQAALDTGAAASGDTVVVLSGMMTEFEDPNTTNMLKVHVASEMLTSGRSVVAGTATGQLVKVSDGDLTNLPEGAILAVPADFDGEFSGDLSPVRGIVDGHSGMTGYAAIVARELGVPMICDAEIPVEVERGSKVTLDAERGVLYADPLRTDRSIEEEDR